MKTPLQSVGLLSLSLFVAACGGKTEGQIGGNGDDQSDSGTSDGGGTTDSGTCKPMPGCNSTTSCQSPDGCNDCTCYDGNWECGDIACIDASTTCPASPPDVETYCQENDLVCTFGTECGPEFVCRNHEWGMVIRTCPPPPPACPSSPPSGSCIGQVGVSCSWGSGCNEESCQCVDAPGGPSWECEGTACVDAGSAPDASH